MKIFPTSKILGPAIATLSLLAFPALSSASTLQVKITFHNLQKNHSATIGKILPFPPGKTSLPAGSSMTQNFTLSKYSAAYYLETQQPYQEYKKGYYCGYSIDQNPLTSSWELVYSKMGPGFVGPKKYECPPKSSTGNSLFSLSQKQTGNTLAITVKICDPNQYQTCGNSNNPF